MCPRFPYPLEKGDKLRIYHQLRYLGTEHEVLLIALTDEDISDSDMKMVSSLVSEVKVFKLQKTKRILSLAKGAVSGLPFSVAYYFDRSISRQINNIAETFQPDHIYCQLTRMAEYAKNLPFPKTIDYMDAFGVGMERRADVVSGITSFLYKREASRMKKYEVAIYVRFDRHTVISEQDRKQILDKKMDVIPNGIDTSFFKPLLSEKKYDIGFVGNMGYPPNVDAAEYLINKVKPELSSELRYIIAGARPDKRVIQLLSENVKVTGWLDDVRSAYAESKIFVAPLWLGTGQQNKILEAMAMGIPCVTSSSVNNAIGARPNEEILVANNVSEFKSTIEHLLSDQDAYKTISAKALSFVEKNYSWKTSVDKLSDIFAV